MYENPEGQLFTFPSQHFPLHYFVFNWRKKGSTFHEACFLLCMLSHSHVWRHIIYLVVPTVTPAATQTVSRGLTALNCCLLVSAVVRYIHMYNYWVTCTKHSSAERYFFHQNIRNLAILPLRVCSIKARHKTMTPYLPLSPVIFFCSKDTIWCQCSLCECFLFFSLFFLKKHDKEALKRAKERTDITGVDMSQVEQYDCREAQKCQGRSSRMHQSK